MWILQLLLLTGFFVLFLVLVHPTSAFEAFDTHDVPENAELIYITITNTVMDQTQQQQPQPQRSLRDHVSNSSYTDDPSTMRARVRGHPKVKASQGLPYHVSAHLVCRGVPVNLELQHYYTGGTGTESVSGMSMSNDISDMLQSGAGQGQEDSHIPVFTRGSGRQGHVVQDDFPRMYDSSCRTLRDYRNHAYFLLIEDPEFSSFKFLGSFVMGGDRYFVEPYASANRSRDSPGENSSSAQGDSVRSGENGHAHSQHMRAHVSTQLPALDFQDDLGRLSLPENLSVLGRNRRNFQGASRGNRRIQGKADPDLAVKEYIARSQRENLVPPQLSNRRPFKPTASQEAERLMSDHLFERARMRAFNQQTSPTNQKRRRNKIRRSKRDARSEESSSSNWRSKRKGMDMPEFLKHRAKRMAVDRYRVEVFIVCDYLCYLGFQRENRVTDETATKNAILQFFSLVQEALKTAYGGLETQHKDIGISIDVRVVGVYIATTVDDKIIGDYVIGNAREIDTIPSIFEFALWVQDKMKVSLQADHYALVTGYDLAGDSREVIGQVSRVPSACDIDRVSLNEFLIRFLSGTIVHELGHTLGAMHDSSTNGVCRDEDGYVMASSTTENIPNNRNAGLFSVCSTMYFHAALRRTTNACLKRDDFQGQTLPFRSADLGNLRVRQPSAAALASQDTQCELWFEGSSLCRQVHTEVTGSWESICSARACTTPARNNRTQGMCVVTGPSLDFTSCGDHRWCQSGACVASVRASEKPVDCPAGDSDRLRCDVRKCAAYDDVTRFVHCCDTCKPIKTERYIFSGRSAMF